MTEHICGVCFQPSHEHDDDHFPPRCCYGCRCGETMPLARCESRQREGKRSWRCERDDGHDGMHYTVAGGRRWR